MAGGRSRPLSYQPSRSCHSSGSSLSVASAVWSAACSDTRSRRRTRRGTRSVNMRAIRDTENGAATSSVASVSSRANSSATSPRTADTSSATYFSASSRSWNRSSATGAHLLPLAAGSRHTVRGRAVVHGLVVALPPGEEFLPQFAAGTAGAPAECPVSGAAVAGRGNVQLMPLQSPDGRGRSSLAADAEHPTKNTPGPRCPRARGPGAPPSRKLVHVRTQSWDPRSRSVESPGAER